MFFRLSIFVILPFQQTFENNSFWSVGNILHRGQNFNAVVAQCLFVDSRFVLVAAESVQLVNQNVIPLTTGAVFYHALKVGTVVVRSRHCSVYVLVEYDYVVLFCVFFANPHLPFDGLLGLAVARITGIYHCCLHNFISFDFSDLSFDGRNGNGNVGNMTPCCNGACRQGLRAIHLALDGKAFPFILPVRKT